jgi:hypothetical protein
VGRWADGSWRSLDLSPPDLLEMAASVFPGRPELMPPGVTLTKVIDRYLALR